MLSDLRDRQNNGMPLSKKELRTLKKLEAAEVRWKAREEYAAAIPKSAPSTRSDISIFPVRGELTGADWSTRLMHMQQSIGSGTFGRVYRTRLLHMEMPVAVKMLRTCEAMAVEVRAMRLMAGSPRIVALLDHGPVEGAGADRTQHALLLEKLQGSLDSWMETRAERAPWCECALLLLELCEALAACKAAGVTHRDVKPPNVFVTTGTDGLTHAKLGDFGIACGEGVQKGKGCWGTPRYLAPELVALPPAEPRIGCFNDCWAAGLIGYQLFKRGKLPSWLPQERPKLSKKQQLNAFVRAIVASPAEQQEEDEYGFDGISRRIREGPPPSEYVPKLRGMPPKVGAVISGLLDRDADVRMGGSAAAAALRDVIGEESSGAGRTALASSDALVAASLPAVWSDEPDTWPQALEAQRQAQAVPSSTSPNAVANYSRWGRIALALRAVSAWRHAHVEGEEAEGAVEAVPPPLTRCLSRDGTDKV